MKRQHRRRANDQPFALRQHRRKAEGRILRRAHLAGPFESILLAVGKEARLNSSGFKLYMISDHARLPRCKFYLVIQKGSGRRSLATAFKDVA